MSVNAFSKDIGDKPLKTWQSLLACLLLVGLAGLCYWVAENRPYTPASDLGYYMGMAGGLMMASMLLYPIRKYWKLLSRLGSLRAWFVVHIFCGIFGPVLILLHSTFKLKSFNASVAFWTMIIVAVSGLCGRFIFTQVYLALERRKKEEDEAAAAAKAQPGGELEAKYLDKVHRTARLRTLAQLLAWWQIMHVPFVYILAISAIAHTIAVHMY